MLPTFPYSPLPAGITRTINWGENVTIYDNGEQQADSPFVKPLLQWSIPIALMTELKQQPLWDFVNDRKGQVRPFLIKDAYEFNVGSVVVAASGVTQASTAFVYDVHSFMVRPDTHYVGSLFSAMSGYVTLGNQFTIDQDTGILHVNTKNVADVWSTNSGTQYFRKAKFQGQYSDSAKLWNIWTANVTIVEVP